MKLKLLIIAIFIAILPPFNARAQEQDLMKELLSVALNDLSDPEYYSNVEVLPSGARIVWQSKVNYNIKYIVLTNHANKRFYIGFADLTEPEDPALLWGKIGDTTGDSPKIYLVSFNVTSTLEDIRPMGTLKGTYNFGEGFLKWNGTSEKSYTSSDYYRQYTTRGKVGETTSGFYPETLETSDILKFAGSGRGSAIQRGEAEGREQYIRSVEIRGPRGGYRGTNNNDQGYIEYHLVIERLQPMTYTLNSKTNELNIKFAQSQTPSIKYLKAPNHPVMNEIKQSYSKWPSKAPIRFKNDEKFMLVAILPDWLVLRRPDDEDVSALSYWLIPRDGYKETIKNPMFPWETMKVQVTPTNFGRIVENYFNYMRKNWKNEHN